MKCRIILGLSAILFFTGCYNREHISRLDEAEALLQNKPDSALTILKQLRQEGSQAEQARYALLYSEALDKNHIKVTDDSLIRQAWSHYKHYSKDLRHQCKTLYYCKHSVNHVFFPQTSVINFTSKKQSYDDTRRSSRDNELLQRAQSDL